MSQQELEVGDNVIIKSEEELLNFWRGLKRSGDSINEGVINDWLERTLEFKGKVIEITKKDYHFEYDGRILYHGKHGTKDYSFYGEELIKVNTPAIK